MAFRRSARDDPDFADERVCFAVSAGRQVAVGLEQGEPSSGERVAVAVVQRSVNRARRQVLDQGPRHRLWTGHPMLYGVSPALLPPPADWPANARLCGQWLEPADGAWSPPAELEDFLKAGEPPVYVGSAA